MSLVMQAFCGFSLLGPIFRLIAWQRPLVDVVIITTVKEEIRMVGLHKHRRPLFV